MKRVFFALFFVCFFLSASPCFASDESFYDWVFGGNNEEKKVDKKKEEDNKININFSSKGSLLDGGEKRALEAGDRAKNQGFADYRKWSAGLLLSAYAIPHQDGSKSSVGDGVSFFLAHYLSPYFHVGASSINQNFSHLSSDYSDSIKHNHVAVYGGFRRWVTQEYVASLNFGLSNSEVAVFGKGHSGVCEYVSAGVEYALSKDDSSRVGYRYISISGASDERNIGMSLHGVTFVVLF